MSEFDTPDDIKKPGKDVSPWLAYKLGVIHSDIASTNGKVDVVINEVKKINGSLNEEIRRSALADQAHDGRLAGLEKTPILPNQITFKWILEKLALPVVMLIIGGAIALLFT